MRDFKELLTGQGEDLFHKNMRKFGATVIESHQAFKDIKEGNTEGGGSEGSASGGGDNYEYLDVSGLDESVVKTMSKCSFLVKGMTSGVLSIFPPSAASYSYDSVQAVAVDLKSVIFAAQGMAFNYAEYLSLNGIDAELLATLPRITKEEFYTL